MLIVLYIHYALSNELLCTYFLKISTRIRNALLPSLDVYFLIFMYMVQITINFIFHIWICKKTFISRKVYNNVCTFYLFIP